jgi:hypothetical protein
MQRDRIAMLINNLISGNIEPAMQADKCRLPETQRYRGQTGEPDQNHSGKTEQLVAGRFVIFHFHKAGVSLDY